MQIRWMSSKDLDKVKEIDAAGYSDPYSDDEWRQIIEAPSTACMVAAQGTGIQGFELHTTRKGGKRIDLLRVAVHPLSRRKGTGRKLVDYVRSKLPPVPKAKVVAVIHEENEVGRQFLQSMEFKAIGVDPKAFGDRDGYVMVHAAPDA